MPVIAYNTKGSKDIIEHEKNGFLVNDKNSMAEMIIHYFLDKVDRKVFKDSTIKRCQCAAYQAETILNDLQRNINLLY